MTHLALYLCLFLPMGAVGMGAVGADEDLPPVKVEELDLFPSREACDSGYQWACENVTHLERVCQLSPTLQRQLQPWLDDARWRKECWRTVHDARDFENRGWPASVKSRLGELRFWLEPEPYYSGRMPTPINLDMLRID